MDVRVHFEVQGPAKVLAYVAENPSLRALGPNQDDALAKLLPIMSAHYQAKVGEVRFGADVAIESDCAGQLSNEKLRALAKKFPPPQSWFEEEKSVL
jgi:hypothetical protein